MLSHVIEAILHYSLVCQPLLRDSNRYHILVKFQVVRPDDQSTFLGRPSEFMVVSGDRTTGDRTTANLGPCTTVSLFNRA